jgi:zinc and cadmium transporter
VSPQLGLTTALAIVAHEIPQEAGDFAILLAAGYSRLRAVSLNLASAAGGILGASAMLLFGSGLPGAVPYVLAFAAGSFLYIAMADLIPSLHHGRFDRNVGAQVLLIALGILTIVVF